MELISNNGYGMVRAYISWNQAERWWWKWSLSTANTPPQPDFARPEQYGREKSEDWFHELKLCIRVISYLSLHTLDSRWLTSSLLSIDPQNSSQKNQCKSLFLEFGGFSGFRKKENSRCSWCMILSKLNFSLLYDNKGICLSYSSYLASSNKCL